MEKSPSQIDRHDAEASPSFAKRTKGAEPLNEPPLEIDGLAHAVIGAAITVHKALGPGYHEATYQEALVIELRHRSIPFEQQVPLDVVYRGETVGAHRLDLLVGGDLVVELKAVEQLGSVHVSQVISYLKAGSFQLGLLINFNVPLLQQGLRRVLLSP